MHSPEDDLHLLTSDPLSPVLAYSSLMLNKKRNDRPEAVSISRPPIYHLRAWGHDVIHDRVKTDLGTFLPSMVLNINLRSLFRSPTSQGLESLECIPAGK